MIDPKDVLLGDRIVGIEHTALDDHGPGAIGVEPMAAPPDAPDAAYVAHASGRIVHM